MEIRKKSKKNHRKGEIRIGTKRTREMRIEEMKKRHMRIREIIE